MHNQDDLDESDPWSGVLMAVMFALHLQATHHTAAQAAPMQLVFGRDALANVQFEADWNLIKKRKQQKMNENNKRRGPWWKDRHEEKRTLAQQGDWELVFIGDSITHGWERNGKAAWDQYYGERKALNLGFGGDRTEHVLWRLDHGEFDGYKPRVAVIMIGTNNTGHDMHPPESIAAGIQKIVATIQKKSPDTKILLLGIFPRGATTDDPKRVNNDKTNDIISAMADEKRVFFLNINDEFLTEDGVLTREIMPDLLHPKEKGYAIWAEAIEPTLARLYDMK